MSNSKYLYIDNQNLKDDIEFSFLNALELPKDTKPSTIQALYNPGIHDIQLRTSYFIFNRIISIAYPNKPSASTPTSPLPIKAIQINPINYTELKRLCNLLETGYYNFNHRHHSIQKGGSGNVELLRKNYCLPQQIRRSYKL